MNSNGEKNKFNNFIIQGGILALTGVLVKALGLLKRIPLTYIIGDVGNAYFSAAFDVYTVVLTISSYGIPLSVSKLVSARVSKNQYKNADKIFKCALVFAFISGLLASVFVYAFSDTLAKLFKEPMSAMALRALAPTLFVVALLGVFRGYFQGIGTMVPTAISQLIEQVVLIIVSLSLSYVLFNYGTKVGLLQRNENYAPAYGASGATFGCFMGSLVGLIFLMFLYKAYRKKIEKLMYRDPTIKIESTGEVYKALIFTIVPVVISSTVNNLSNIVDHILHNRIMVQKGFEDIMSVNWGIYSGKYSVLINVPIAIGAAMGTSSVPTISGLMKRKDYIVASEKIGRIIRITMMVTIPCAAGLFALAPSIMWTLFSTNSPVASNLLRIGAIGVVLFSYSTLTNSILQGMSKLIKPITHGLIALALHMIILVSLLEFTDMKIYAVALSNNFFSLFICLLNVLAISRILDYRQEVKRTFLLPAASATVMGIVVYFIDKAFTVNGFSRSRTVLTIIIGAVIYFVLLVVTKAIGKEELTAVPGGTKVYNILKKIRLMK